MLTYLDESRQRGEDERWYEALESLLACVDRLELSSEAATRWAICASAEQVEDRAAELLHLGRLAA